MPKYEAAVGTRAKLKDADSKTLSPADYFDVKQGQVFEGDVVPCSNNAIGLKLSAAVGSASAGTTVYLYRPHVKDLGAVAAKAPAKAGEVKLPVCYFSQNNNEYWGDAHGSVQCCPTSNAMLLHFVRPELHAHSQKDGFCEFESYYKTKFEEAGYCSDDRGDHTCHTETLKLCGVESNWTTSYTDADIRKSLDAGFPVVCGVNYKSSGHIMLIVGYNADGYHIHDPYGSRAGTDDYYAEINEDEHGVGAYEFYSYSNLDSTLFGGDGGKNGAWARMVTSVNGKATGLK